VELNPALLNFNPSIDTPEYSGAFVRCPHRNAIPAKGTKAGLLQVVMVLKVKELKSS
jgi:hypothetical protein